MPSRDDVLFGRIAVHNKILTQPQFDECITEKELTGDARDIGDMLLERGYLSPKQLSAVNKARAAHMKKKGLTPEKPATDSAAPAAEKKIEIKRKVKPKKAKEKVDLEIGEDGQVVVEVRDRPHDENAKKRLHKILSDARRMGASDIHMSCGAKPHIRLHGNLRPMPKHDDVLEHETNELLFASTLSDEDWQIYAKNQDLDTCIHVPGHGRYRTNVCHQRRGCSAVFRCINEKVPTLKELGLPEVLERMTTFHQGLVLVTGSSGSGKSSTLAALIDIINATRKENVITLEDPIEYVFKPKKCNIIQRQIDLHTRAWGNALRAALREDPDVIMVGEMRDLDTVSLAITAAETGHLVLGTLHTTNATRTIDRILDVFPPKEQGQIRAMVSESLKGVVSQQLVPRADGKGRIAALEIMFWTPAVANLIREKQSYKLVSILQTGRARGMCLMDDSLKKLVDSGDVTKAEARSRSSNPKMFA